ncbi:hypothetical protein WA026_010408 [Henosepilachna vigintioctopunctata]|uniref:LAGLIDADG homing endonuclease n=1 Tax=Henosepilachna vigintioctopunctata TaxID=420089 RepID=A0AAW1V6P5_9CUCU
MVKVGGYILGEFGNLIAGDQRSSLTVQFQLLHSKYHLCSPMTRALLHSTYVKFINLFSEIRTQVQEGVKIKMLLLFLIIFCFGSRSSSSKAIYDQLMPSYNKELPNIFS